MSSSIVLNPKRNFEKKNNKKFGMFLRKKNKKNKKKKKSKISTKKKTKSNSTTKTKTKTKIKTKTGKIKMAFRKKLKGRSRKEKSAVTALFVLSTDNKQKKEEQLKKHQLLEKLENGLNSATSTEQGDQQYYLNLQKQIENHEQQEREQRQQQKKKEKEKEEGEQGLATNQDEVIDLSHLRSLYTPYSKPTAKKQPPRQEPQKQQLDCGFLRNRLGQQETQITEDTTSTYEQFGEESYDDSLSEDLPSSSNEDFYGYPKNTNDLEIDMDTQCYLVSDDEMESLGDEIEIQFGSMQNEQNTHQLIFPEKISFVSSSYGIPSSYPKEYLFGKY